MFFAVRGHLGGLSSAITMLNQRISISIHVLEAMKKGPHSLLPGGFDGRFFFFSGLIPMDHALLRQISSLAKRLPVADSAEFALQEQKVTGTTSVFFFFLQ